MKVMSFNCRGLVGPPKRLASKSVVSLEHPDVILFQETLGGWDEVKLKLERWFSGRHFEALDVKGRSGGLAVGWDERSVKVLNLWGMESVLGMTVSALDLGEEFNIMNNYGPYQARIPFWDDFFSENVTKGD